MQSIKDQSFFREGRKDLLFSTPDNPYESIYIYAEIKHGCLVITDSECDHAPDGGWSHQVITFDAENTEKAFSLLCERNADPFLALADTFSYEERTRPFLADCRQRGVEYTVQLFI